MNSKFLKYIIFPILIMAFSFSALDAQQATDVKFRQTVEHIKQQLAFLKDINRQFPNQKVEDLIRRIETRIAKANQAYNNKKFRIANQEIAQANRLIGIAMQLVLRGPLTIIKEQLEEKILRAKNLLQKNFRQDAQGFLQKAQRNKEKAVEEVKRHNFEKAVGFYNVANTNIKIALDLLTRTGGDKLYTAYLEEKANFEQLIHRIQGFITEDQKLTLSTRSDYKLCQDLYKQALNQQKQAQSAFNRHELKRAIEHYGWGTRLVLRAINVCQPSLVAASPNINMKQTAFDELQQVKELIRAVEQTLTDTPLSQQNKLFRQAQQVYSDASRSFNAGKYSQTVQKVRLAKRIIDRVSKISTKRDVRISNRFEQELDLLRNLMSQVELQVKENQNPVLEGILLNARQFLVESRRAYANGNKNLATAKLFAATKFVLTVKSQLNAGVQIENLRNEALAAFTIFEQKHLEIQTRFNDSADPFIIAWYGLEAEIYQLALDAKNSEKYELLLENSRVGMQLIDRIEKHAIKQNP